jgi:hypothetical protein
VVPVFVEMAVAPKLVRGKTHRGNKWVKQSPNSNGPFSLAHRTTWSTFVKEIAEMPGLDKENLTVEAMTWSFQKKTVLPLTNKGKFQMMIQQIRILKDPSAAIIVINLLTPKQGLMCHNTNNEELTDI